MERTAFVLRQVEVPFESIREADIFRLAGDDLCDKEWRVANANATAVEVRGSPFKGVLNPSTVAVLKPVHLVNTGG